jgi:EAL domain-containing protein (putative c-di-GMP-specific phosphodiesterase class I)
MQSKALERFHMETKLRQAISEQQLQLFYQPIVDLNTFQVLGLEALIRWQHPQRGWILPHEFIPLAQQTGLIIPLGDWILGAAGRQLSIWQDQFLDDLPLSLSVHLTGIQLDERDIGSKIIHHYQSLQGLQVTLKLEITESILMINTQTMINSLDDLRAVGIKISIDDFGTGYSPLSYLFT